MSFLKNGLISLSLLFAGCQKECLIEIYDTDERLDNGIYEYTVDVSDSCLEEFVLTNATKDEIIGSTFLSIGEGKSRMKIRSKIELDFEAYEPGEGIGFKIVPDKTPGISDGPKDSQLNI